MKPIVLLDGAGVGPKSAFIMAAGVELLRMLDEAGVITLTAIDKNYIQAFWTKGDQAQLDMVWRLHPELVRLSVFDLSPLGGDILNICGPKAASIKGYPSLDTNKYIPESYRPHLEKLADNLNELDPNVVVALGNTAMWALCGVRGVAKFRGTMLLSTHTVKDFKVLITYNYTAITRQYELRTTMIIDLMRLNRECEFPEIKREEREIWIAPDIEDIIRFREEHIKGCELLSVDIETAGNQITCIGFAPNNKIALVVPFLNTQAKRGNYWTSRADEAAVWKIVKDILADPAIHKLFQNGLYDIAFLWRSMRLKTYGAEHDTMLLSHALQPESLKGLGFLGSLYGNESAWKVEHKTVRTIKRGA